MSARPDPGIRVLVVDDHPIWREGTARCLYEAGYTIAGTAGDGAQALRIIAFGSSSTEGVGASSPAATYPSRLLADLKASSPIKVWAGALPAIP